MNRRIVYLVLGVVMTTALVGLCSAGFACPFGISGNGGTTNPFQVTDSSGTDASCVFGSSGDASTTVDPFQVTDPAGTGVPCPFGSSGNAGITDPFQVTDSSGTDASCVFGSSGEVGTVDPFQITIPTGVDVPCPFGNSGDTGAADPFQVTDQSGTGVPCPFPQSSLTSGEASSSVLCGGESPSAPSDPDGDGSYEDLNGNGRLDFNDVILYFQNMAWIRENEPVGCFDYNANGNVDFADLILLFHEIG